MDEIEKRINRAAVLTHRQKILDIDANVCADLDDVKTTLNNHFAAWSFCREVLQRIEAIMDLSLSIVVAKDVDQCLHDWSSIDRHRCDATCGVVV